MATMPGLLVILEHASGEVEREFVSNDAFRFAVLTE